MVDVGIFRDHRLELLHGRLVEMSPQRASHASTVQRLTQVLVLALNGRAEVRVQLPLAATEDSEPEPDIAVVAPGDYDEAHPSHAFVVIEVADTSLDDDRELKRPIYEAAEVPEYWIVNLRDRRLEIYRPKEARPQLVLPGERIALAGFNDIHLAVDDILPSRR